MARTNDSLRLAKVVASHPEAHAVDLIFLDNGAKVPMVQVSTLAAGSDFGHADLPQPDLVDGDPLKATGTRDIYALTASAGNVNFVVGFLPPQVCQILFKDMNRRINRHASDVYTSTDADGNFEIYHPSGTYLRIGTAPAHEDLTGLDFDKKWKIAKNTDKAVHVHLGVSNAGVQKASLDIDPSGNFVGTVSGTADMTSTGNMSFTAPQITFTTPHAIFSGDATASVDFISNGKSGHNHTHLEHGAGSQTSAPT